MWPEIATAVGAAATAIAVLVAAFQLYLDRQFAKTAFEDALVDKYRDIVAEIPVAALLGQPLSGEECRSALPAFYRYVDLCNEQIFLHECGRIRGSTWVEWEPGLRANFARPAFRDAWAYIDHEIRRNGHEDFAELRALLKESGPA